MKITICLMAVMFTACYANAADEKPAATKVKRIGVEQYEKLRANTNNVVLDVRSKAEFEKGHVPGAVNIDINSLDFQQRVTKLDSNKTYLVNCAVGMRSAKACKKMEGLGFKDLYDLAPGFDGWKKAAKPIENGR
jgi:rhodanese-related sulfurtransferase